MSNYNKTIWKNGDIITSEKLNNIENGITNKKIIEIPFSFLTNESNSFISETGLTFENLMAAHFYTTYEENEINMRMSLTTEYISDYDDDTFYIGILLTRNNTTTRILLIYNPENGQFSKYGPSNIAGELGPELGQLA